MSLHLAVCPNWISFLRGFSVSFSVITSKPSHGSILINENFDESEEQRLKSF